ncbi:hypothetical protein RJ639_001203 [Escallonia herrerae]|uniref:Uncharacterized protein n=1 Tax=Escallonia herrerae TaxID=1293975 RepID=A0AA88XHX4_9ASTE|nr:hypothetical protein RJ639_001203 [Escallonia herrerae]
MSPQMAKTMTWFHDKRRKDRVLRHPADSKAWENFDNLYPTFALDPCNVRLGLSTNGNNIDLYLRPLVEELKILFDRVETYDALSKTNFTMHVAPL